MTTDETKIESLILCGHVKDILLALDDKSIDMIVTSIPYYGLRCYGTDPQIWDGNPDCKHVWGEVHPPGHRDSDTNPGSMQHDGNKNRENLKSDICVNCGAWKGELGMEPTPELYVQHMVEIFREARRVLKDTGTFWLNVGDSYAANRSYQVPDGKWTDVGNNHGSVVPDGLKPKDLIGIPWMLAFALRSDGWYLRSDIPWIKRNAMPSSVKDRPSSSIEHVFLFSKSRKYYYDYVAVMQKSSESYNKDKRPRGVIRQCVNANSKYPDDGQFKKQDLVGNPTYTGFNDRWEDPGTGLRYMRDSDFFFRTWQGLLQNEDGEPMALVVNPRSYKGAHFAVFPVQLVEPMILAGTSEKGVCPACGKPWVRITTKKFIPQEDVKDPNKLAKGSNKGLDESNGWGEIPRGNVSFTTTEWIPSCSCGKDPVPATVLDPFNGSGSTGIAAIRNGRDYIGIDLNPDYCALAEKRISEEAYK